MNNSIFASIQDNLSKSLILKESTGPNINV